MRPDVVVIVSPERQFAAGSSEAFAFTILPDFLLQDELQSGQFVRLVPDWTLRSGGVYTVTPLGRVRSNALQRFFKMAQRVGLKG